MKIDLVFEGGGVTGISYVGAFKALEESGYKACRCAGTSAGSVIAALIAAGYNSKELTEVLFNTDFGKFLKKTSIGKVPLVGLPLSLMFDKGLYDSKITENWIGELLAKKGKTKFKHVMEEGKSKLKIIAADITRRKMLVLPDDLTEYGINPFEFDISKAVRMSCAIPLFFTPYILDCRNKRSFIVDGGLLSSFPIWIFDISEIPKWPTFGIKIKNLSSSTAQGKTDIISYIKDIVTAPISQDEENFIRDKDYVRTVIIDYDGKLGATGFAEANNFIKDFYDNGYNSTTKLIKSWEFKKYSRMINNCGS
ncbi:patatin-like phospholipase family protein [Clostridium swellfunianum]|uniref:patatin-like phospholipase family protein n=1 Tax=Clostridium swellfunianum TaxID=1367462 RepID=UPI00202F0BA0|nr:patatin-like phospholipase family protein [Clostridium swellfunianum]MCM0647118.1 patatin-like phospholipase family protein [Clostridium swellfunianum]